MIDQAQLRDNERQAWALGHMSGGTASLQEHLHPAIPCAWQVAPLARGRCCAQWKERAGFERRPPRSQRRIAAAQRRAAHGWARLAGRCTIVPQRSTSLQSLEEWSAEALHVVEHLIDGHRCRCARRAQTRAFLAHHSEMRRQERRAVGAGRAIGRSLAGELSLPRASCPSSPHPSALLPPSLQRSGGQAEAEEVS